MAVLYPPYIEGKLPAQVGNTLRIPYQLNRALGVADLNGKTINCRIKTIVSNDIVAQLSTTFEDNAINNIFYANIDIATGLLNVGDFYKLQLSFGEASDYYSTVGVFKYTTQPIVSIAGLDDTSMNGITSSLSGEYFNTDMTEKPYYYKYDIYANGALVETSDWCIFSSENEPYVFTTDFLEDGYYAVRYTIRTVNDLVATSPLYHIIGGAHLDPAIPANAIAYARADYETGVVHLGYRFNELTTWKGRYRIHRFDGESWEVVSDILIDQACPIGELTLFDDYTVEQGHSYQYAIQQYDAENNIYTARLNIGGLVWVDFEDAFLWDGKRQLTLRFDPKVSSFKTNIQENKMDTIGGKYPVFFRNGRLAYKEFPISGLISYHMDEHGEFLREPAQTDLRDETPATGALGRIKSTNLTGDNISAERDFKLKVLEWLNNGKPKLFRSPGEGNYLVRLMNVSLSPNDTLGRMLHSFSATAYEIADCNLASFIEQLNWTNHTDLVDKTNHLVIEQKMNQTGLLKLPNAVMARISDAEFGSTISLTFANGESLDVRIGNTGYYAVPIIENNPLTSVKGTSSYAVEYAYYKEVTYPIMLSEDLQVKAVHNFERANLLQWNGPDKDLDELATQKASGVAMTLEDFCKTIDMAHSLRVQSKDIYAISSLGEVVTPNGSLIYQVGEEYYVYNGQTYKFEQIEDMSTAFQFTINGETIDLATVGRREFSGEAISLPLELSLGKGVYADILYRTHRVEVIPS